jgi:ribosomal protein S18 acetylase RimI-like enzyme
MRFMHEINPEVQITPLRPPDVLPLAELAVQTHAETHGITIPDELFAGYTLLKAMEIGEAAAYDEFLLAKIGQRVAGYVQFGDPHPPEPGVIEVHKWYVARALQGQGIGRRLADAAASHPRIQAADAVCLWVWGGNEQAIQTYGRAGFRCIQTRHYEVDGRPSFDLKMWRAQR